MQNKLPITALVAIVTLMLDSFDVGKAALADGKVDFGDVPGFVGALPKLGGDVAAVVAQKDFILPQLLDLDSTEAGELLALALSRGITDSEKAKETIAGALEMASGALRVARAQGLFDKKAA